MKIVPLESDDLPTMRQWLVDPETAARFGGLEPLESWFSYARSDANYHLWKVEDGDGLTAISFVEADAQGIGSIAIISDPSRRRRGLGRRALSMTMDACRANSVVELIAAIDSDNVASISLFRSFGFSSDTNESDDSIDVMKLRL